MTDQISVPLTADESAVLAIAARGMPMIRMEHGRWTEPIDSLLKRGFLADTTGDKFNCVITDAGRAALHGEESDTDKALGQAIDKMRVVAVTQKQLQALAEQSAQALVQIARQSSEVMGDSAEFAAEKWSGVILDRAKEILR